MKYLFVVAHPDDEILGAGGLIYNLTKKGNQVSICYMCSKADARFMRPKEIEFNNDIMAANKVIGTGKVFYGEFPNIKMNNSDHLELVKLIEKAIVESDSEVVFTHHPSDTNNDHLHTSLACQAAIRLFQRRKVVKPIKAVYFMEVLSSTEWAINSAFNKFNPNSFFEIGIEALDKKIESLQCYRNVMRDYPHPRSAEAIKALATYRGAQSGCYYAEAFECVFNRVEM